MPYNSLIIFLSLLLFSAEEEKTIDPFRIHLQTQIEVAKSRDTP